MQRVQPFDLRETLFQVVQADDWARLIRLICADAAHRHYMRDARLFQRLGDRLRHLILIHAVIRKIHRRRNQSVDALRSRERPAQRIRVENIRRKSVRPTAYEWLQFLGIASNQAYFLASSEQSPGSHRTRVPCCSQNDVHGASLLDANLDAGFSGKMFQESLLAGREVNKTTASAL